MVLSASTMRILLVISMLGMAWLAVLFLRKRNLTARAYLVWGFLIILLPALGPFLVLFIKPGTPKEKHLYSP
jgi:hypothetical protein